MANSIDRHMYVPEFLTEVTVFGTGAVLVLDNFDSPD